ncbi:hypothetical protein EXIGLDRAFT_759192 [Exidia glandulosa HHB12029]|uniref:Ricin B lectin domain-containing protein n=1 Tax=Exidia glandulosa HHB12029 TaxID=1314781 RepID=A0A165QAI5_EXIGL|nr:hypothetical protein EXIGLDRAFT_759192 [Exidia glandulosa HHB12029]
MRHSIFPTILVSATLAAAAPVWRRVNIDDAATAEAQQRDNGATRALSAVPIKTSNGQCLSVDLNSGDFRHNLMNVVVANCDGSSNQQFDVITQGAHNNIAGQALIVSSSLNNCLNFDPRRQPGNQVLMFSCGGRADGGGQVTDSQLFAFTGNAAGIPLVPLNSNRDGTVCLKLNGNTLDQSGCNPAQASGDQLFTLGDGGNAGAAPPPPPPADEPAATPPPAGNPAPPTGNVKLDPEATAEAQQRDNGATRAFTAVPVKVDGQCLTADLNTGDFRQNLMEIKVQACDGSPQQQFDIITSGKHNDQAGKTLIVSSLTNGCLNVDERRQSGNQVLLFSCGGRADGGGQVTNSQLFAFDGNAANIPLVPANVDGAKCLFNNNGVIDVQACNAASPSADQSFSFGDGGNASAPAPPPADEPVATPPPADEPAATPPPPAGNTAPPTGNVKLDPEATAEAQQRDDGATRAFSAVPVKVDGQCLTVDLNTGDFRQNLMAVKVQACDGSPQQQFDIITAGKHNDQAGKTLIVSSLTQGCLNVDERRQPGNQVLLFSCGGRADGGGQVTNSQLFAFDGTTANIPLVPANVQNKCLFNSNGVLDLQGCDAASPSADQTFSIA